MENPADLRYTREHEWARIKGGEAVVGVTFHAQEELGDVVFLDLPAPGAKLTRMKPFGAIESVKAVSDLYAPLSGEVLEVNKSVVEKPELVNQDPYGQGWLLRMKVSAEAEAADLMDAAAYTAYVAEEKG